MLQVESHGEGLVANIATIAQSADFLTLATNFGVAFACLVALSIVVWRCVIWFGIYIAKPVAERHIKFLDELSIAMASQAQALQAMSIQQGKNIEGIDRIMLHVEKMMDKQDEIGKALAQKQRDNP